MTHALSASLQGVSFRPDGGRTVWRSLPDEVPVAMVFDGTTLAVMMATPGDIEDFALGFALTEGIISGPDEIDEFEVAEHEAGIEARMWLRADRSAALKSRRRFMAGPVGCGLCGIDSIEQAARAVPQVPSSALRLSQQDILLASDGLRQLQPLRDQTGATHAAGFLLPGQGVVIAREDVGRHNALDKLIGALLREGTDPATGAFVMTSRLSVELVQKCAMARCPLLISVSAPTAAAQRLAEGSGITLAAFARGGGFDVYSHAARIAPEVSHAA